MPSVKCQGPERRRNGNEGIPRSVNSRKVPVAMAVCILATRTCNGDMGWGQSHEYSSLVAGT